MANGQCLSCGGSWDVGVIDGAPFCRRCSHRADVPREECTCLMCMASYLPPIESPIAGLEFTLLPDVPELPLPEGTITEPESEHVEFGEYVEALLAMAPTDFTTRHQIIELLADVLFRSLVIGSSRRDFTQRVPELERLKKDLCDKLEVIGEVDAD